MAETIKAQEQRIRDLLQKHVHRTLNKEHEAFVDLLEIMMAQDKWLDKLDTIQAFKVTRSRQNKALILQVKVDNANRFLTVSWRNGSSKKRKVEDPLPSAFRHAIHRQIMSWKKINSFGSECVECKDINHLHKKLQADHKDPLFIQLTTDFLTKPINQEVPIEFDYHKCGRKLKKRDNRFKQRWKNYHRQHATLQWLCRNCNLSKRKINI